jgi:hypothetical protein
MVAADYMKLGSESGFAICSIPVYLGDTSLKFWSPDVETSVSHWILKRFLPKKFSFPHVLSRQLQKSVNCSVIVVNAAVNIELCHWTMRNASYCTFSFEIIVATVNSI